MERVLHLVIRHRRSVPPGTDTHRRRRSRTWSTRSTDRAPSVQPRTSTTHGFHVMSPVARGCGSGGWNRPDSGAG